MRMAYDVNMTLTEFALARIAEDEADIRAYVHPDAQHGTPWHWRSFPRLIAEVDAKRWIVASHEEIPPGVNVNTSGYAPKDSPVCGFCGEAEWPCPTILAIARIYADHPDYDEAWCTR